MREVELWRRLETALGQAYAHAWADQVVLSELGGRTVTEALRDGVEAKLVWRAAWAQLELSPRDR
ncbi:MAG: DUF3046 domain-containing protein [Actinomycetia bacterium]|nr:DUF3046 domain-containing protein [Actinomycetes bacterium]